MKHIERQSEDRAREIAAKFSEGLGAKEKESERERAGEIVDLICSIHQHTATQLLRSPASLSTSTTPIPSQNCQWLRNNN